MELSGIALTSMFMTLAAQIPPLLPVAILQPFSHKSWFRQCRLMGQKAAGFSTDECLEG